MVVDIYCLLLPFVDYMLWMTHNIINHDNCTLHNLKKKKSFHENNFWNNFIYLSTYLINQIFLQ